MTKENIIKLLEHEKSICKKLKKEYRDEWMEAILKGDTVARDCSNDLISMATGQIMVYERVISIIEKEM